MQRILKTIGLALSNALALVILLILVSRSDALPADSLERIRRFTRSVEFNYVQWMLDALELKNAQAALDPSRYLNIAEQREVIFHYLDLVANIDRLNYQISLIYADPNEKNPETASADLRAQLTQARDDEAKLGPLAESIIQAQLSYVLDKMNLTTGGQPLPPVLYRITPLPYALIVSPRDKIEQEANISLLPGLSLDQRVAIEDGVTNTLDKSALVVAIGGVGVYPTMVQSTTDLSWLTEVVAHEWTHNYLTLRPLGINYDTSPELRTINETTASISGKEVGRALLERFYPERVPPPPPEEQPQPTQPAEPPAPPAFDFRAEMHITRVHAEELLSLGKIDEAEAYMEARRKVFWDHGYLIRKLNQAYFAFYGAYNDTPGGGASGADPVGPAVQALRKQSPSLAAFLNTIAQVTSFEQLQKLVK